MTGKATPGPWQVHGSHIYTADPDRALLAQVHNPGSKSTDFPLAANARLIAAAPDLLATLKTLRPMVGSPDGHTVGDVWRAQKQADAAIAQAEPIEARGEKTPFKVMRARSRSDAHHLVVPDTKKTLCGLDATEWFEMDIPVSEANNTVWCCTRCHSAAATIAQAEEG